MQNIDPALTTKAQLIQSYGPAGFRVGGTDHASSILLGSAGATAVAYTSISELTVESFASLFDQSPPLEVLLIGTGATHQLLPHTLRAELKSRGLNADAMNTGAACRTFNVLLSEERRVAALLLIPQAQ